MTKNEKRKFASAGEFYPFYLEQHEHPTNRTLHFVGTTLFLIALMYILVTQSWRYIPILPLLGYGFAWVGHLFIEKNKPATFTYPWLSFVCDFRMYFDVLRRRVRLR